MKQRFEFGVAYFYASKMEWKLRKNGKRRKGQRFARFMGELFLWLRLGIASRRLSTVCSLPLGQGRISSLTWDVQACLPSRTATRGKRLCTRRLRRTRPSRQQRWFHGCPASSAVLRVPRLCVRCVRLQPFCSSENQGLSAKTFHRL
jgi:hypothetical protein